MQFLRRVCHLCGGRPGTRRGISTVHIEGIELHKATETIPTLLLSPQSPPPVAKPAQTGNFFVAAYDAFVFSYCIFDVAILLHTARAMGAADLLESPESLMLSPRRLVQCHHTANEIGSERLGQLARVLEVLLTEHEATPRSVTRAAEQCHVTCSQLVPFLRGVCLCTAVGHPFVPQVAYVLEALQTHGVVSPQLFLDGSYLQRQQTLARLLLCSAKEFGSAAVLYTALQLMSQQPMNAPDVYAVARSTTCAFAKEDRRLLDWALKTRGKPKRRFSSQQG